MKHANKCSQNINHTALGLTGALIEGSINIRDMSTLETATHKLQLLLVLSVSF